MKKKYCVIIKFMRKCVFMNEKLLYLDNRELPFIKYDMNGFPWIVMVMPKHIAQHSHENWQITYAEQAVCAINDAVTHAIKRLVGYKVILDKFDMRKNRSHDDLNNFYKILRYMLIYAGNILIGVSKNDLRAEINFEKLEYVIEISIHSISVELGQKLMNLSQETLTRKRKNIINLKTISKSAKYDK